MSDDWEITIGLVIGGVVLMLGILVRLGWARRWVEPYFYQNQPYYVRNGSLAFIPGGLTILLMFMAIALGESSVRSGLVKILVGSLVLTGLVVSLYIMLRPPDWIKPAWLLEEERRGAHHRPGRKRHWEVSRFQHRLGWVVIGAMILLSWLLDWHPATLIGIGMAMSMLAGTRVRREDGA